MINIENIQEIEQHLSLLKPESQPLFGKLGPQHMIEHLTEGLRMSTGKAIYEQHTPDEKLPLFHKFLMSDKEMPIGTKVPFMGDEPPALINQNLEEAKSRLMDELNDFQTHFGKNPDAREMHPVFGNLNKNEWLRLHGKHFLHHFKQFGLIR